MIRLHPFDVVVALRSAGPEATFAELAAELSVAPSQVHHAFARLDVAGLVRPGTRAANRLALMEFLEHGVRYAFPAEVGSDAIGVPTAHSGPDLAKEIDSSQVFVWPDPSAKGAVRGKSVTPLYRGASKLKGSSPETYRLVALVDAIRVGRVRERKLATEFLRKALTNVAA